MNDNILYKNNGWVTK